MEHCGESKSPNGYSIQNPFATHRSRRLPTASDRKKPERNILDFVRDKVAEDGRDQSYFRNIADVIRELLCIPSDEIVEMMSESPYRASADWYGSQWKYWQDAAMETATYERPARHINPQ